MPRAPRGCRHGILGVMHDADDNAVADRRARVLARIRATPVGFVRSYGDVSPGAPRYTGTVLSSVDDPDLPWHRIVHADGSLAKGDRQRALLEAEGVPFRGDRVDMRVARLHEGPPGDP